MKKLFLIFILIPIYSYSQITLDTLTNNTVYSKIHEIQKSKKELHQKAIEWIAINFKDANEVVKLNTEDKIIAKGNFSVDFSTNGYSTTYPVKFIMEIAFKEQKYKLDMNSFIIAVKDMDITLAHHMNILNYDEFVDIYRKSKADATYKYEVRYYDKILNDPEKLNELFIVQKSGSYQFINNSNNKVRALDKDLYNYLSSEKENEW